jgi:ArsR family transcriptional regulator
MPARVTGRSLIAAEDTTPRGRANGDLRLCATSDRLDDVIDNLATTEEDRQRSAAVARALGDPKRLCVLESLAGGEASVGELAGRVACQVPNMSQHLSVLRSAGLVTARRDGSTVYYRLSDPRILEATQLLQSLAR